jgi:hypothetical protein
MVTIVGANLDTALALAGAGLSVFPCHAGGDKAKQPMPFIKWRDASTTSQSQIRQWWQKWPDAAIGLDLGKCGLLVVDADRHGEHDGVEAFGSIMAANRFDPDSAPLVATPNHGNHHFFRQPDRPLGNGRGSLPPGVDVRGEGGYVIAPGTVMADGRVYELFGDLAAAPAIPDWLAAMLEAKQGGRIDGENHPQSHAPQGFEAGRAQNGNHPSGNEIEELLSHIPPDIGYQDWIAVLMALHAAGASIDIADAWSSRGSKYKGRREIEAKWRSFKRTGVTSRSLAMIAEQYGADLAEIAARFNLPSFDAQEAAVAARRLIEGHDGRLRDAGTGIEVAEPTRRADPPTFTDFPPGLVGTIARWIVDTARRPQPELAIGAALAIVGTACGRHVQGPTEAGTALYVLSLAPTGKGKETPLKACMRVLAASGMGMHIGPDQWMSMSALINMMERMPLALCAQDEFGAFMQRIFNRKASTHERAIPQILRSLWGVNFGPWTTPQWANGKAFVVDAPHLTIYGTSTHEQFYSAMEGAAIADGTLNRFLVIEGRRSPELQEPKASPNIVPDEIVNGLKAVFYRSGNIAASQRNQIDYNLAIAGSQTKLGWCADGSRQAYEAFMREIDRDAGDRPLTADFIVRAPEMAIRIATILAAGQGHDSVRRSDVEFGIAMVRNSLMHMISGADEYMAGNDHEANVKKVLRIIRQAGRIEHSRLLAQVRAIRARDLKDIISNLVEEGSIIKDEVETKGRKRYDYVAK